MKLDYEVHTVVRDEAPIIAQVNGKDREVRSDVLTVELAAPGSGLTFRFDDIAAAEKIFKPGKKVTLTFAGAK